MDVTEELLAASKARLDYFYGVLRRSEVEGSISDAAVVAALEDDLNTPQALTALHDMAKEVERSGAGAEALKNAGALLGPVAGRARRNGSAGRPPARMISRLPPSKP